MPATPAGSQLRFVGRATNCRKRWVTRCELIVGDAKKRKRAHAAIFDECPHCIYCGGDRLATTVDHVPPRALFWSKSRPKGLEFASCQKCNQGTRLADLVASVMSRMFPDPPNEATGDETARLFAAVKNNIPDLLEEMLIDEQAQGTHRERLAIGTPGGFLRANGPLVSAHMQTFAFKTGFALYYEASRKILPKTGAVAARWFSNVEHHEGKFPQFDFLLAPKTLRQGKLEVSSQFSYQWRLSDDDQLGAFVSYFRQSFAVVAFVAVDKSLLLKVRTNHPVPLCQPGELTQLLAA